MRTEELLTTDTTVTCAMAFSKNKAPLFLRASLLASSSPAVASGFDDFESASINTRDHSRESPDLWAN